MIWCIISSIEAVESKPHHQNSIPPVLFLLVVLSVQRQILNNSQVYNSNNDGDKPDMNILLTSSSVTGWVATLLPTTSQGKDAMVIVEGWPGWLPVLDSLIFTVDTVYYSGKILKYQRFSQRCLLGRRFLVVIIGNVYTRMFTVILVRVQLVF